MDRAPGVQGAGQVLIAFVSVADDDAGVAGQHASRVDRLRAAVPGVQVGQVAGARQMDIPRAACGPGSTWPAPGTRSRPVPEPARRDHRPALTSTIRHRAACPASERPAPAANGGCPSSRRTSCPTPDHSTAASPNSRSPSLFTLEFLHPPRQRLLLPLEDLQLHRLRLDDLTQPGVDLPQPRVVLRPRPPAGGQLRPRPPAGGQLRPRQIRKPGRQRRLGHKPY